MIAATQLKCGANEEEVSDRAVGAVRTVHVEDVVVVGLPHRVGRHAAVRAVVGLVEVFDEQVGARDDRMGWDIVIHLYPVDLLGPADREVPSFIHALNQRLPEPPAVTQLVGLEGLREVVR